VLGIVECRSIASRRGAGARSERFVYLLPKSFQPTIWVPTSITRLLHVLMLPTVYRLRLCCFALALAIGAAIAPWTMAEPPELSSIFPMGGGVASTVEVEITGKGLTPDVQWWFSTPEITAEHLDGNRYRLTIGAAAPLGALDVWVATNEGLAGPRRFTILAESVTVEEEGAEESPEKAGTGQLIPLAGIVDAKLDRTADIDYFAFEANSGECVTVSCRSASLDGRARPVVSLISPSGVELAHSSANRLEPQLTFRAPRDGTYQLKIHDSAYELNAPAHYRVEIHRGTRVAAVFPHILSDSTESLLVSEYRVDKDANELLLDSRPVTRSELRQHSQLCDRIGSSAALNVAGTFYRVFGTGYVPLRDGATSCITEDESRPSTPQSLSLPAVVSGRFLNPSEVDWYRIQAKKGETYQVKVYGQRWAQLMDVELAICDLSKKVLLELKDTAEAKGLPASVLLGSLDPSGEWKAPADGEYLLAVRDLYGGSVYGPDRVYELRVHSKKPSSRVVVLPATDKVQGYSIKGDSELAISLFVLRDGGCHRTVRVALADDQQGFTAEPVVITDEATTGMLKVKLAGGGVTNAGGINAVRLVATVEMGSDAAEQIPVTVLGTLHSGTPTPSRRTEHLLVHVLPRNKK
jgi:hypothetical protein